MLDCAVRINLKPGGASGFSYRKQFMDYCLFNKPQRIAIGWSGIHKCGTISSFDDFYSEFIKQGKAKAGKNFKLNPVLNIFRDADVGDLFWTRDLDGFYWICRATGKAEAECREEIGAGAFIPVEAYKYGIEVPGQIKASFNRPNGGTAQRIQAPVIYEFSKYIFNLLSGKSYYSYELKKTPFLANLPDFELEELVISYIQITQGYYLLSNSIASKSTTPIVECVLRSRSLETPEKAVVQVKGPRAGKLNADDFFEYYTNGYTVFLYGPGLSKADEKTNVKVITPEELLSFYTKYKAILPESITKWENLFLL